MRQAPAMRADTPVVSEPTTEDGLIGGVGCVLGRSSADVASRLAEHACEVLRPRRCALLGFGHGHPPLRRSNHVVAPDAPDQSKEGDCTGRPDQRVVWME